MARAARFGKTEGACDDPWKPSPARAKQETRAVSKFEGRLQGANDRERAPEQRVRRLAEDPVLVS
jgi:hypothetical protein